MKNNYVLGLNFLHSDSSACLFENNELVVAAEEERFLRVKHTTLFPFNLRAPNLAGGRTAVSVTIFLFFL